MAADRRPAGNVRAGEVRERAPAKVNLFLHLTGRRADGYHLLDGLVAFARFGDRVAATPADGLSLRVTGPFAEAVPAGEGNLALAAAAALRERLPDAPGAAIRLDKQVPVAAGLGGGSSDAAAVLRALARLWRAPASIGLEAIARGLGADVPMCLAARPARIAGIGDAIRPCADFPALPALLVNPRRPLATPEVFRARSGPWRSPLPEIATAAVEPLLAALAGAGNDLTEAARSLAPEIGDVLAALEGAPGCRLARMSGSGATCFGLFADAAAATRAARRLRRRHPGWWVRATCLEGATAPR